jgi:uncharacterized protein (TIGR01777 family)
VVRLARASSRPAPGITEVVRWDPAAGAIDTNALARARPDAVVNLAGEVLAQRWTRKRREMIRDSRVKGTALLARALATLPTRPQVFVSGSAIGHYGAQRRDELLDEDSTPGIDFLAETAVAWEEATRPAAAAGIRVVLSRTGLVLGKDGGLIARVLLPFKLGIGGKLGSGRQWMSWIALDDTIRALRFFIDTTTLSGAFNVVAPEPVRNAEFTATLARVLRRPAIIPVPSLAIRIVFGMAEEAILSSQRITPKRLAGAGFVFRHPRLEEALRYELTRSGGQAGR